VSTRELIAELNPVIRGWGQYFCKAHIRKLFARLDRWILRRIWSQRFKRWRCRGWTKLPGKASVNPSGSLAFQPVGDYNGRHACWAFADFLA
jgi:Group II intron, maturase-specific domain